MNKVRNIIQKAKNSQLAKDEEGLTTVEYIIILILIAVLAIAVWRSFGDSVRAKVSYSNTQIQGL